MIRQEMSEYLAAAVASDRPFWGIAASRKGDVAAAGKAGASWVTVTHGGTLDPKLPASVMGMLPYANANAETLARGGLVGEVAVPVFAGVFASDQFNRIDRLLEEVWEAGFRGVQNFPSVGLAEDRLEAFLRESDMGYAREIDMARKAHAMGFFVSAVVFGTEQAEEMVHSGADMVVFHPGLNADGEYRGGTQATLRRFDEIADAARRGSKSVVLARMAFERETLPDAGGAHRHGVQYDRNVEPGRPRKGKA